MKRTIQSFLLGIFVMFTASFSCGQNGPTNPSVTLNWTQSTTPGITKNCIYRGTVSGTYSLPGTCIPAGTTFTDTTVVAGNSYFFAVTAQVGATESAYSAPAEAIVPANPNAPTGLQTPVVTKTVFPDFGHPCNRGNCTATTGDLTATVNWRKQ
jgi:hypothetical protein